MSDFANFESATGTEEDPAAAFLAREQDQMAELEGDGFVAAETEQTAATATPTSLVDEFATPSTPPAQEEPQPVIPTMGDDILVQSDNLGTADANDVADMFGAPAAPSSGDFMDDNYEAVPSDPYADAEPVDPYTHIGQVDKQRAEPEKIRIWREEQVERLAKQDADEEVRQAEWKDIAKRELEDWYKHREEQLEKSKANNREANREAEAAFCQERDESLPGHEWERVTRLCEFNPKAARNAKDVSRMRSILLQLKQSPITPRE